MARDGVRQEEEIFVERSFDPFGLVPEWRSKIVGLGGGGDPHDLNYVLHTVYAPVAEGAAHFRLRFNGLTGKFGTMILRVHMYQKGSKDARLTTSDRILLSRLVQLGGIYEVRFQAFLGVVYALYASIEGPTDASANALEVTLDRPGHEIAPLSAATEARNSDFGRDAVTPVTSIISTARATLANPVSQRCTAAQIAEPVFKQWSRRLGRCPDDKLNRWCAVYVLQVLECYGLLCAGADGLGLGAGQSGIAALAAAAGASIEVSDVDPDVEAALARLQAAAPSAVVPREALRYRSIEEGALPRDLVNFDFVWSERVATRLGTPADGIRFVERAMATLRPGGLAVHVVDFALDDERVDGGRGIGTWTRRELDRMALILISHGHEVAEIKVDELRAPTRAESDGDGNRYITAAGLITRKARTVE